MRQSPIEYSFELLEEIADHVAAGKPMNAKLREISARIGKTLDRRTVNRWRKAYEEAGALFDEARDAGGEEILDEIRETAETPMPGKIKKYERVLLPNPDKAQAPRYVRRLVEVHEEDMLGHRKLKIETLFKLLAQFDPRKYGNKAQIELTGKNGGPVQSITAQLPVDPLDAARVYQEMMQATG